MAKQSSSTGIVRKRLKEGSLILFSCFALFLLVALVTYSSQDPGWTQSTGDVQVLNAAGPIGAWFANLFFFLFGYLAYCLPVVLILTGIQSYRIYKQSESSWSYSLIRGIGVTLLISALATLFSLHWPAEDSALPETSGGLLGEVLVNTLLPSVNDFGLTVLSLGTLILGITLCSGFVWLKIFPVSSQLLINYLQKTLQIIKNIKLPALKPKLKHSPNQLRIKFPTVAGRKVKKQKPVKKPAVVQPLKKSMTKPNAKAPVASKNSAPVSGEIPALDLLEPVPTDAEIPSFSEAQLAALSSTVEERLMDYGIKAQVVAVYPGPVITRFEIDLAPGIKVSKITGLAKDLARSLSVSSVRVVEVIPGKSVVGLEIPNEQRAMVSFKEILASSQYQDSQSPLTLALGKDISGEPVAVDLASMPHLLVAGTTGSGKSVGLNAMLLSLLYKSTPEDVRIMLIDPKMLELAVYDGIPHLLAPVITDMKDAANSLRWCVGEMERRYQLMAACGVRNLKGYNHKVKSAISNGKPLLDPLWPEQASDPAPELKPLPYLVVIIDEFADMMMVVGKKVEELIARIAQKARAAGIHMILATQRPSVDVITGLIKANVPSRIAFQVSSRIDSRTILDQQGAEQLLGYGDMLYLPPGSSIPTRVHGAFVSDDEVHAVVKHLRASGSTSYVIDFNQTALVPGIDTAGDPEGEQDPLYDQAVQIVLESRKSSISFLQRRLKIGYNRSARLIEAMEEAGVVSAMGQNGQREILIPENN